MKLVTTKSKERHFYSSDSCCSLKIEFSKQKNSAIFDFLSFPMPSQYPRWKVLENVFLPPFPYSTPSLLPSPARRTQLTRTSAFISHRLFIQLLLLPLRETAICRNCQERRKRAFSGERDASFTAESKGFLLGAKRAFLRLLLDKGFCLPLIMAVLILFLFLPLFTSPAFLFNSSVLSPPPPSIFLTPLEREEGGVEKTWSIWTISQFFWRWHPGRTDRRSLSPGRLQPRHPRM